MKTKLLGVVVAIGGIWLASPAKAHTIDWTLSGTFIDGGTFSGTFQIDSTAGYLLPDSYDITTTAGFVWGGDEYVPTPGYIESEYFVGFQFEIIDLGVLWPTEPYVNLQFEDSLTTPGVDILNTATSFECGNNFSCTGALRFVASGEAVSATPLPAALPLFATGLGVTGLFGWRRKQKKAAASAA
jgi:hypothetical protein